MNKKMKMVAGVLLQLGATTQLKAPLRALLVRAALLATLAAPACAVVLGNADATLAMHMAGGSSAGVASGSGWRADAPVAGGDDVITDDGVKIFQQDRFLISYWVGPQTPLSELDERFAEIAAANFTGHLGPSSTRP